MMGYGVYVGWFSPFLLTLKGEDSPLKEKLSTSDESWIGSLLTVGTATGTLIFGKLGDHFGAKSSLVSCSFLFVVNDISQLTK